MISRYPACPGQTPKPYFERAAEILSVTKFKSANQGVKTAAPGKAGEPRKDL